MPDQTTGPSPGATRGIMDNAYLVLVLTNLFWGGNIVAGKLAVGEVDPYTLMILRWFGAVVLILPFAFRPLRRTWPIIRRHWALYLFYGAIGFATFNVLTYLAAHLTAGVNIAMEQVMINILVMAFNFIVFRQRVRSLQIAGAALTIVGVMLTVTHGNPARLLSLDINLGDGLVMLACLAWAIYSLALRYRPATDWLSFLVVTCLGAAVASLLFQSAFGGGLAVIPQQIGAITWEGWLIVAYTTLFPSILSQMLYVRGVELIGANRASLFINLLPLFGTIGSILVVGESLETFHLIAAALIVVGIVLAEWSARRGQITVSEA